MADTTNMNDTPGRAGSAYRESYDRPGGYASRSTASNAVRNHEKREHRAKKRYYREKHREAKETFSSVAGVPVETESDAIEALARALKSGTYKEVAQLIFASAHFCWACDEIGEDEMLREDASEPDEYER